MIRLLFWFVIGALLVAAVRKIGASPAQRGASGPRAAENIVRCCVCGLNLPQSEAQAVGPAGAAPRWACCVEHARDAAAGAS